MTEEQIKAVFFSLDIDGNGTIDCKELSNLFKEIGAVLTPLQLKVLMTMSDIDANGTVSFSEFSVMFTKFGDESFTPKEYIKGLLKASDKNESGRLSRAELHQILCQFILPLTEEEFEKAFKVPDIDSEGRVDWEEFLEKMKTCLPY